MHEVKGREWERVRRTEVFTLKRKDQNGKEILDEAEARIFYVALTRAKLAIEGRYAEARCCSSPPPDRPRRFTPGCPPPELVDELVDGALSVLAGGGRHSGAGPIGLGADEEAKARRAFGAVA